MDQISKVINEAISGLTTTGINRIKYMPSKMDIALSVLPYWEKHNSDFIITDELTPLYEELVRYFHGTRNLRVISARVCFLWGPPEPGKLLQCRS